MTVSFYFSIDNLGEDKRIEKRFGFRLGQIEVYFVPETDITDIGQFRRCYTLIGGVGEPQIEYLDEAAFLEGEMMRVVFQIHQDHLSAMHLCKTSSDKIFEKSLELNRLGFCNAASRATDFLGIFADGPDCEKWALHRFGAPTRSPKAAFARVFTIESLSLLQYEEAIACCQPGASDGIEKRMLVPVFSCLHSFLLLKVWPELKSRAERLLWMISDGCNKQYTGLTPGLLAWAWNSKNLGALDSRAKALGCVFTMLVSPRYSAISAVTPSFSEATFMTRGMKACSAILKSIDLLILRPEDKGALMPHLGKLVRLFDFLISMEMSDQCPSNLTGVIRILFSQLPSECLSTWEPPEVHLLGHCVAGDEHRSAELLMFDNTMFSVGLQNCLSADARRAHRDNVIARNETGSTEVNSTIRLQNAALFCLSALGLPQSSAELQDKGCILEKKERAVGRLHPDDAARLLRLLGTKRDGEEEAVGGLQAHPAVFPAYTLMCVVALKRELCIKAAAPSFQALIVNESNLPNVYVSLEDFTVCVQVRTKSGRLESAQSSISIVDQAMPVAVTVVVDGLLVFLYLNGKEALDQPKRLSDYAAEVQAGEILCGRSTKAVETLERGELRKEEDPVLAGAMLMMRFFPRAMVAYEVDSKMGVARSQAAKVLKRKPGSASDEIPLTVYNIIEVTQLVIQFTQVQLSDESLAAMGKKKAGLQEVLDPDTIMWMVLALGTAAIYLPHQHPKFLELIKQPFVKVMQMIAGIIDGASSKQQLSNYEQAFIAACTVYVAFVLASPRGKNIMQDDLAAKLIIKMNAFSDSPIDFSDYVIKNCQSVSSRVAVLILRARQETPATLALVLDAVITRIVNEDGVIFKEDLQEFLVDQGLGAVVQVLHFVGRGLLNIERRERDRKKMTAWLTTGENEERARQEKADRLALEQVGTLAARMHRQLFLQLHHVMDEVIHGLPLDEVSMLALVRMVGTVLEVPQVMFMPAKSLRAERMQDIEVAEGMPYECWRNVSELSCDKLRVWTEKFYPMSLRTFGEVSTMLEDLQEQVVVRDRRHISSPRLEIGAMSHTNRVWIHFQSSQPEFLTDTEVRILPVHDPPLELPRKKSGHKYCAEPSRLVAFANAVLRNPRFNDEVYANTVVLLAELNLPELYTSM
ncbi:yki, partial [Symbiodinium sp. CCMP2456]